MLDKAIVYMPSWYFTFPLIKHSSKSRQILVENLTSFWETRRRQLIPSASLLKILSFLLKQDSLILIKGQKLYATFTLTLKFVNAFVSVTWHWHDRPSSAIIMLQQMAIHLFAGCLVDILIDIHPSINTTWIKTK